MKPSVRFFSSLIWKGEKWRLGGALVAMMLWVLILGMSPVPGRVTPENQGPDPWTSSQILRPEELVKELKSPQPPVIIHVGVWSLYRRGHVPGALYAGPASDASGLEKLQSELKKLSQSRAVVIYCGCCPFSYCPNIRPAFRLAKKLGFTKLKVLYLPNDFGQDWVQKEFPVEKSE